LGTHRIVFDVDTGEMRTEPMAGDGNGGSAADAADTAAGAETVVGADTGADEPDPKPEPERLDPEMEAILDELAGTNVNEVPAIELMAKVQKWQERLGE
jgi:DNA mismatch repair protein MutS